jgi:hypothetical protein
LIFVLGDAGLVFEDAVFVLEVVVFEVENFVLEKVACILEVVIFEGVNLLSEGTDFVFCFVRSVFDDMGYVCVRIVCALESTGDVLHVLIFVLGNAGLVFEDAVFVLEVVIFEVESFVLEGVTCILEVVVFEGVDLLSEGTDFVFCFVRSVFDDVGYVCVRIVCAFESTGDVLHVLIFVLGDAGLVFEDVVFVLESFVLEVENFVL